MKNVAIISTSLNEDNNARTVAFLSRKLSKMYNVYLFLLEIDNIIYDYAGTMINIGSSGPFYEYLIKLNKKKYNIDVAISFTDMLNFANIRTRGGERIIICESGLQLLIDSNAYSKNLQINKYYCSADEIVVYKENVKYNLQHIFGINTSITTVCEFVGNDKSICENDKTLLQWINIINVEEKKINDRPVSNEMERLRKAKYILIYGTGLVGKSSFLRLSREYKIDGFVVSKISEGKRNIFDKDIYEIDEITLPKEETAIVIGVSYAYQDEVVKKIEKSGYDNIVYPWVEPLTYDYYFESTKLDLKLELVDWARLRLERNFDIDNPKGFNEKIQWLKLYDNVEIKTKLADKYLVRDYVSDKIGDHYLIPLLGVWNSVKDIDFNNLPDKFVLKCNHASETNIFVEDKKQINYIKLQKQFQEWLNINYAYWGFEMQYARIKPRIIAEQMLIPDDGEDLKDYKVFVFNGKAKIIQVDIDRQHVHRRNLYDVEWQYLPYSIQYPTAPDVVIDKPKCLEELISISEILGSNFRHVRVDFYICNQQIYFGEMTFTHGNGAEKFEPLSFEKKMGDWIDIS